MKQLHGTDQRTMAYINLYGVLGALEAVSYTHLWRKKPERFVQFARRVFHVDYAEGEDEWTVLKGIERLEAFYRELGLPTRLSEANIGGDRIREMADNAMIGTNAVGMSFPLQADDIYEIFKLAL